MCSQFSVFEINRYANIVIIGRQISSVIKTLLILMAMVLTSMGCERDHEALEIQCLDSFIGVSDITGWPTGENDILIKEGWVEICRE